jgi:hypothetical protein
MYEKATEVTPGGKLCRDITIWASITVFAPIPLGNFFIGVGCLDGALGSRLSPRMKLFALIEAIFIWMVYAIIASVLITLSIKEDRNH